jgi:hypothetical protein
LDAWGSGSRAVIYQLDADDVIVWTNDAFRDFAVENQAASLVGCRGKCLWPFIFDWDTRSIYQLLVDRVRRTSRSARFSFRCDSPCLRRYMEMEIALTKDTNRVEFRCQVNREEVRDAVPLLPQSADVARDDLVKMCSWCLRIQYTATRWLEVEDAVEEMKLFEVDEPPLITHGICSDCFVELAKSLK